MSQRTYICKYTPIELMIGFGAGFDSPNNDTADFSATETIIHQSLCSHAKMLALDLMRPEENRELILTNCCDSIRRVNDAFPDSDFAFRRMLDLPHTNHGYAIDLYAKQLTRLMNDYAAWSHRAFDRGKFLEAWQKNAEAWQDLLHGTDSFIAVLGARVSDELFQKLRAALPLPLVNLTCGGLRPLPLPPENAASLDENELIRSYAKALLAQTPCMRMDDVSGRARLLRIRGLGGVVYHSVKFCDYYSFEYAELRRHSDLPILKIESDYTAQSEGQLTTRIEAFAESMGSKMENTENKNHHPASSAGAEDGIYVGIDSGSTSTNLAAIDKDGNLAASVILRTGAKAGRAAEHGFEQLKDELGPRADKIRRIIATGYGREFISFADASKTEISCHARGAHFADPNARTIIDIGGQDSKVICLDEDGNVQNFVMNDKCAAGTGRFLEMMAHTLEISMDEMSQMGLSWKKDLTISSTCTVFAESEVVSLIAENTDTRDIIHALDKSVAGKTVGMVRRVKGTGPYMMTGGVAKNQGVTNELSRRLGEKLSIMKHPDLIGALGAALYARDMQ